MIWLLILFAPSVLMAYLYNRLVRARNRAEGAWSDIDVQLQRRHDLIPQLVTAVDQYASYESATIEAVTTLRAEAMNAHSLEARGQAEDGLSEGLVRLIALAEQYPDLKANENFLSLQLELVETEDYLQFARRYYNGSVRELNTSIETVPSNLVAQLFGFTGKEYFQLASDEAAAAPLVKLTSVE
jgi:LemA protein